MWIITKDIVDCGEAVNTKSRNYDKNQALKYKFRMFDGDDSLYYEGLSNDCDSEEAFSPLDDFGMPNAGCTDIHYYNEVKKEWEPL